MWQKISLDVHNSEMIRCFTVSSMLHTDEIHKTARTLPTCNRFLWCKQRTRHVPRENNGDSDRPASNSQPKIIESVVHTDVKQQLAHNSLSGNGECSKRIKKKCEPPIKIEQRTTGDKRSQENRKRCYDDPVVIFFRSGTMCADAMFLFMPY